MKKTGDNTHRATQRGYAIDPKTAAGVLVEEGDIVPADQPVSDNWMEPIKKGDRELAAAIEEAQDPLRKPADLSQLKRPALEALAAGKGVNVHKGLSDDDLRQAITAADEPTL
jgi:hypothetical protein